MEIVPFKAEHVVALKGRLQPMQRDVDKNCNMEFGAQMESIGNTWTALHDGVVLGCGGAFPMWEGRAHLWTYLSEDIGRHMLAVTREIPRKLKEMGFVRYEAEVSAYFPQAQRWVRILGFHCETPHGMEAFFPDQTKGYMFSKVMP